MLFKTKKIIQKNGSIFIKYYIFLPIKDVELKRFFISKNMQKIEGKIAQKFCTNYYTDNQTLNLKVVNILSQIRQKNEGNFYHNSSLKILSKNAALLCKFCSYKSKKI